MTIDKVSNQDRLFFSVILRCIVVYCALNPGSKHGMNRRSTVYGKSMTLVEDKEIKDFAFFNNGKHMNRDARRGTVSGGTKLRLK